MYCYILVNYDDIRNVDFVGDELFFLRFHQSCALYYDSSSRGQYTFGPTILL